MVPKRFFAHEAALGVEAAAEEGVVGVGGGSSEQLQLPKRQKTVLMTDQSREAKRMPSMEGLSCVLEPFLRKVVREEVEKTLRYLNSLPRTPLNQINMYAAAQHLRLQFDSNLPGTLFAGSRIEAEDGTPVRISIVDNGSNSTVTSGPLSSAKVEILVIDGDFGVEEEEQKWAEEEFRGSIVREREGKRPLLTGDLAVTLQGGVGVFGDVNFTDNSSWIRSRKFRLGVRVVQSSLNDGGRIQEGLSGAFLVKDHRGELYKKHFPPSPTDEVWRLKKIGKDGAFHRRLTENNIKTVQDLLRQYVVNQEKLRGIFGGGMSNKTWDAIVQHAWSCEKDNKLYSYYDEDQQVTVYFDSIFRIISAKFRDSHLWPYHELNSESKMMVNRLRETAHDQKRMVEIVDVATTVPGRSLPITESVCSSGSSLPDIPCPYVPEFVGDLTTLRNPSFPSPANLNTRGLVGEQLQHYKPEPCCSGWSGMAYDNPLINNNISTVRLLSSLPFSPELDLGNGFVQDSGNVFHNSILPESTLRAPLLYSSRWIKLKATVRCWLHIRKRVAAKRRARAAQFVYQP